MTEEFSRTEKLIGSENVKKLNNSKVIVFGVGGVGSYAAEAISRAGVGTVTIVDNDTVSLSNINRQLPALHSTVGQMKVDVLKKRILDINPWATVSAVSDFFSAENAQRFNIPEYDYVLDCIDSVPSKIFLIKLASENNVPIISAMGTGNKLCPEKLEIADISETCYCPLARSVRTKLKKEGIEHLTVVYSKEPPVVNEGVPASISFVPSAAGLLMASKVIKDLIK